MAKPITTITFKRVYWDGVHMTYRAMIEPHVFWYVVATIVKVGDEEFVVTTSVDMLDKYIIK